MKRLEYIDAMRGLAMLLVVIGHIMSLCFDHTNNYLCAILNVGLELPLFFLISGFFSYKPIETWNWGGVVATICNKFSSIIVPTLFFMGLYIWINDFGLKETLFQDFKYGYWFPFSLFEYILLYILLIISSKVLRLRNIWEDLFMLFVAIVILYVSVLFKRKEGIYPVIGLLNLPHLSFFIYFVLGIIFRKRFNLISQFLNNRFIFGILTLVYLIFSLYTFKDLQHLKYFGSSTLYFMLLNTILLAIVFLLFSNHEDFFKTHYIGKSLQYIGKHTLEIYLIHYFFMPRNLQPIGEFFTLYSNPVLEYLAATFFAIIVILITLSASYIIRFSPLLARWLLGIKTEKKI